MERPVLDCEVGDVASAGLPLRQVQGGLRTVARHKLELGGRLWSPALGTGLHHRGGLAHTDLIAHGTEEVVLCAAPQALRCVHGRPNLHFVGLAMYCPSMNRLT